MMNLLLTFFNQRANSMNYAMILQNIDYKTITENKISC